MYYFLADLLRPLVLADVAMAVALIAVWRRCQTRRWLIALTAAYALQVVLSLPITSYFALGTLEWSYPPRDCIPNGDATAVVVLSGSIRQDSLDETRFQPGVDTLYRCLRAAEIYRASPRLVIVSGGKVHPSEPGPPIADVMRDFLLTQGVRGQDIVVEASSRTTFENATETKRLLDKHNVERIVLVTDAAHLRRAVASFRRQGIEVIPCGCRYRSLGRSGGLGDYLPDASAAVGVEEAAHEWLGLAWYWVTGRI
jgi:uncharacterized SAM-binding protein YcdF (DUF218 family)